MAGALSAHAAVRLELAGPLPCSAGELDAAVAARLPLDGGKTTSVAVRPAGAGAVELALGSKRRVVTLAGLAGVAAARRIALAVVDLAAAEARPPDAPPLPPAPPPRPRAQLVLLPAGGAGTSLSSVWVAGTLGTSLRLHGWLRATLDVGYGGGPRGSLDGLGADLQYLPMRAGLAFAPRRFPVEARVGAVVAVYWARGGEPSAVRASGAVEGLAAAALFFLPRHGRVQAVVGAGVDVFANRAQLLIHGTPVLETERLLFWAGAGMSLVVAR
jgi:hypothetical protein